MFGYVTLYRKEFAQQPAVLDRYQAYYCGLCDALGRRFGTTGRLTLSYDLTFAAMLLSALYDPESRETAVRCPVHPLHRRPRTRNGYLDYAADMSIALAYYNYLDDWQDEHRRASRFRAEKLAPFLPDIEARHPVQVQTIRSQLAKLAALEQPTVNRTKGGAFSPAPELDTLCNCFGSLLGAVFQCHDDLFSPVLLGLGQGLGGFIYLMDAYDDLEKDRRRGSFNALAPLAEALPPQQYEDEVKQLLTLQMGICAKSYALLPILADSLEGRLLSNTIFSGVWCRYSAVRAKHEKLYRKGDSLHA